MHSHALQLRQAKLSFPAVQLLVGVFSDDTCAQNGIVTTVPHLERCELLRHCRWVDEVVPDAPWKLDEAFVTAMRIDYVAIDEGVSIDPAYDKERVKGYDIIKGIRECTLTIAGREGLTRSCSRQSDTDKTHRWFEPLSALVTTKNCHQWYCAFKERHLARHTPATGRPAGGHEWGESIRGTISGPI